jgi:hypothetical protein
MYCTSKLIGGSDGGGGGGGGTGGTTATCLVAQFNECAAKEPLLSTRQPLSQLTLMRALPTSPPSARRQKAGRDRREGDGGLLWDAGRGGDRLLLSRRTSSA